MICPKCKETYTYERPHNCKGGQVNTMVKICNDFNCLIGYWSDGYDFRIYTELEKDDLYECSINDKNSNFVKFKYCPECGRKF